MKLRSFRQLRIGIETPIYIMLMGMLAIQIATPWRLSAIMSLGTWMIIISVVIAFCLSLVMKKIDVSSLAMLIVLAACICVSVILSFTLKYRQLVVALSFLEIPLVMTTYSKCYDKNVYKFIYISFVLLSIYYQVISFTSVANIYYTDYGSQQIDFLTLGYENPNETAMHLFICILVLLIFLLEVKNILIRIFLIVDVLMLMRLIVLTGARTGILILVCFLIFYVFFRKRSIPRLIESLFLSTPIVFIVVAYLFKIFNISFSFLGKTFDTGRINIYMDVFENFNFLTFFFGNNESLFKNLHNSVISIFATIGIIGVIAFFVLLYAKIRLIRNCIDGVATKKMAFVGVLCIVAYTSTEAAFLTTGGTFAIAFLSVYFISVFSEQEEICQ